LSRPIHSLASRSAGQAFLSAILALRLLEYLAAASHLALEVAMTVVLPSNPTRYPVASLQR
jgi:hypothetical protein